MGLVDVHACHDEYQKGVANQDVEGLVALYAPNARLLPPGSPMLEGRDAIAAWAREMFAMGVKSLEMDDVDTVEADNLLINVGRYRLTLEPPGAGPMVDVGKYLEIYERQADGSLQLLIDTFNSDEPAPA